MSRVFAFPPVLLYGLFGFALIVGLLQGCWRLGDGFMHDPFHSGEFFAALTSLSTGGGMTPKLLPLTIHGAVDIVPGWVMSKWVGDNHHFFPTVVAYGVLNTLAVILLVGVTARLGPAQTRASVPILIAAALIAPLCVGFRDVFLLFSLLLHLLLRDQIERHGVVSRGARLLEIGLGIVIAVGLHYSFDRGLAAAFAVGAAYLPRALRIGHGPQPGRVAFIAFCATVVCGAVLHPMLSPAHYLENVLFLASTSQQWRHPWNRHTIHLAIIPILIVVAAVALAAEAWHGLEMSPAQRSDVILLLVLNLVLLKIAVNRVDLQHTLMGVWGPLVLVAWLHMQQGWRTSQTWPVRAARVVLMALTGYLAQYFEVVELFAASALLGLALTDDFLAPTRTGLQTGLRMGLQTGLRAGLVVVMAVPLLLVPGRVAEFRESGGYEWVRSWNHPRENDAISPPGIRWAANALSQAGVTCVFDLSNSGLIQPLVQRPSCSRITYPVYGGPAHEAELIHALESQRPSALVGSSDQWAYAIDGRAMPERFPALDAYVRRHFPIEHCHEGYCMRTRRAETQGVSSPPALTSRTFDDAATRPWLASA